MLSTDKNNKKLKNVLVLIDDEKRKSSLFGYMGKTLQPPSLCRMMTPTTVFTYTVLGLFTQNTKIDDYRTYKKEKLKWDYYTAKLLIFQVDMTKARNFYLGVMS